MRTPTSLHGRREELAGLGTPPPPPPAALSSHGLLVLCAALTPAAGIDRQRHQAADSAVASLLS